MAQICPLIAQWKWEGIPHGEDAYLVSFPTSDDLKRVDGFQMGVPDSLAQMTVSIWKAQDVPHKFELQPVWVHVDGVPHMVRHFLGLWAVGSLIGTMLDVDLVSLWSRGVVRILVAMNEPKNLDKFNEVLGYACLSVSVTVQLKGYDFFFHQEPQGFVLDEGFTPFFWKRKGDDTGNDGPGQDNDGTDAANCDVDSSSANMDVDKPQRGISSSHGKSVAMEPVLGAFVPIAVTPINPNPTTPREKEIVDELRSRSLGFSSRSLPLHRSTSLARLDATGSCLGDASSTLPGVASPDGPDTHEATSPAREAPPRSVQVVAPVGLLVEQLMVPAAQAVSGLGSPRPSPPLATDVADLAGPSDGPLAVASACLPLVITMAGPSSQPSSLSAASCSSPPASLAAFSPAYVTAATKSSSGAAAQAHKAAPPSLATSYGAPPRRSARYVMAEDGSMATDEDTMQKAMRRKATKNLNFSGMDPSSSSFVALPTQVLSSKLNSVGISLGKNDLEINVSANVLRHMEFDRLTVGPKSQNFVDTTDTDDEEAIATLDG
jgi:hypothetical protein